MEHGLPRAAKPWHEVQSGPRGQGAGSLFEALDGGLVGGGVEAEDAAVFADEDEVGGVADVEHRGAVGEGDGEARIVADGEHEALADHAPGGLAVAAGEGPAG